MNAAGDIDVSIYHYLLEVGTDFQVKWQLFVVKDKCDLTFDSGICFLRHRDMDQDVVYTHL